MRVLEVSKSGKSFRFREDNLGPISQEAKQAIETAKSPDDFKGIFSSIRDFFNKLFAAKEEAKAVVNVKNADATDSGGVLGVAGGVSEAAQTAPATAPEVGGNVTGFWGVVDRWMEAFKNWLDSPAATTTKSTTTPVGTGNTTKTTTEEVTLFTKGEALTTGVVCSLITLAIYGVYRFFKSRNSKESVSYTKASESAIALHKSLLSEGKFSTNVISKAKAPIVEMLNSLDKDDPTDTSWWGKIKRLEAWKKFLGLVGIGVAVGLVGMMMNSTGISLDPTNDAAMTKAGYVKTPIGRDGNAFVWTNPTTGDVINPRS